MEDCDAEGVGTFLSGDIFTGVGVSDLVTWEDVFLADEEFGAEVEGRGTPTGHPSPLSSFLEDVGAFGHLC